jgi:hypothetical protein
MVACCRFSRFYAKNGAKPLDFPDAIGKGDRIVESGWGEIPPRVSHPE